MLLFRYFLFIFPKYGLVILCFFGVGRVIAQITERVCSQMDYFLWFLRLNERVANIYRENYVYEE